MPFVTQGKTNWKLLLIVIILATIVGGGALWLSSKQKITPIELPEVKKTKNELCFKGDLRLEPIIADEALKRVIVKTIIEDNKTDESILCNAQRIDALDQEIDLNGDEIKEYVVSFQGVIVDMDNHLYAFAGTGGGPIYLFGLFENNWKVIGYLDGFFRGALKSRQTKGYSNIVSETHFGQALSEIYEYAWNGEKYKLIKTVDWGEGTANPNGPPEEYLELWKGHACLAKGTKITVANGSYKNIEDIKEGDIIESFNLETRELKNSEVTKIIKRREPILNINNDLKTAPDESVYLVDGSTKMAMELKIGDILFNEKRVDSIEYSVFTFETYDLILKDNNTFFANSYLVHTPD